MIGHLFFRRDERNAEHLSITKVSLFLIILTFISLMLTEVLSLIKKTQTKSTIITVSKLQMMGSSFKTRYGRLPGDGNLEITKNDNFGNNDGFVGYESFREKESLLFFKQLSSTGYLFEKYNANNNQPLKTYSEVKINKVYPGVALNKHYFLYVQSSSFNNVFKRRNRIALFSNNGKGVSSIDAYSIDKKIDDGKPLTGKIITVRSDLEDLNSTKILSILGSKIKPIQDASANIDEEHDCIFTPSNIRVKNMTNKLQLKNSEYNIKGVGSILLFPLELKNIEEPEKPLVKDLKCESENIHNIDCINYCTKNPKIKMCREICKNNKTDPLLLFCHNKIVKLCNKNSNTNCHKCKKITEVFTRRKDGYAIWPESSAGTEDIIGTCVSYTKLNKNGYPTRKCNFDNTWSEVINPCMPISCFEIKKEYSGPKDGYAIWNSGIVESTSIGKCIDGFKGKPVRKCLETGRWGKVRNACKPI